MEITNLQRKCMGMEEMSPSWERVRVDKECTVFFDNDVICKLIIETDDTYCEYKMSVRTTDNRTLLCPKTNKGKFQLLTASNLKKYTPEGTYFSYEKGYVVIGNISTQRTYYSSKIAGVPPMSWEELEQFLVLWVEETDAEKMLEAYDFATASRKHCKYKEGDFFRYRIDRIHFGYGRILLDVSKRRKQGVKHWNILMGKPLIVQVYHVICDKVEVPIEQLENLQACPSQYIMDNCFYYGDFEIIGNKPIIHECDYPIMYGKSISATEPNLIIFQQGLTYKELDAENHKLVSDGFRNSAIGFELNIDKNILEKCIQAQSNEPYWNRELYFLQQDIRNPKNKDYLDKVLEQFDET